MQKDIYLDNSATTPVDEQVIQAMEPFWATQYGNPSSPHLRGVAAEKTMSWSRSQIAIALGVDPKELYFTGSGTEANNLALLGIANTPFLLRNPGHIITTPIEHPSVLNVVQHLESRGWTITYLPVNEYGQINPDDLKEQLRPETKLVSVMFVNNELGTIAPIAKLGQIIAEENSKRQQSIVFHVDAIQALGKLAIRIPNFNAHLMTFSGHKIFGPKGIGLLYVQRHTKLWPIVFGGNQEQGLRPGTENIPAIVGFSKAVQLATDNLNENVTKLETLRAELIKGIKKIPDAKINSPSNGASHLLNASFPGVRGEVLVHFLEQKSIFIAMGAACSSKRRGQSHVLEAIGLSHDEISSAIRISLAPELTLAQISYVSASLARTVKEIRNIYM